MVQLAEVRAWCKRRRFVGFEAAADRLAIWLVVIFFGFSLLAPATLQTLALVAARSRWPAQF